MKHLKLFENKKIFYDVDEVINLLKNIKGILPVGIHGELFDKILENWIKNTKFKGEHFHNYSDYIDNLFKMNTDLKI